MGEKLVLDREKGELRIYGKRHTALDAQALCDHLDSLVGPTVAEVIINNHEFRSGKQDASQFRRDRPQATASEIVDIIIETDLLSGTGITKVTIPEGEAKETGFLLEMRNPSVKPSSGCGKALLLSYRCGALSFLFNGDYDAKDVRFNEAENVLTARIVRRQAE